MEPKVTTVAGEPSKFAYLGSKLSNGGQLDTEIDSHITKASSSFGRLHSRVWSSHELKLSTKISVYHAVVLSTLLYAAEIWTPYQQHICKLEALHQRCLRKILKISWQCFTPNVEVLKMADKTSINNEIGRQHLKWDGHMVRMIDHRIPKRLLYGELEEGARHRGRPCKRFKDEVSKTMNNSDIENLNDSVHRESWRWQMHR